MNLDRGLIKSQAKELIKGKVMKLFLTVFIVQLCIAVVPSALMGIGNIANGKPFFNSYSDIFDSGDYSYDDNNNNGFDNFDDFYNDQQTGGDFYNFGSDNNNLSDFENFGTSASRGAKIVPTDVKAVPAYSMFSTVSSSVLDLFASVANFLLMPLTVTLAYFFVLFIRGQEFSGTDGIKFVFSETYSKKFGSKFCVMLLKALFTWLWAILFIIPGIVYNYKTYFAFQIMCDNPEISPTQALNLSKRMTNGHKSELFVLDLSFIPWAIACVVVFPIIYVAPYYMTTQALYYENFKIRALQQGVLTEDDFLSDKQRMEKYAQATQNGTYQQQPNAYASNANYQYGATYYAPNTNANTTAEQPVQQPTQQAQPQENVYYTATAPQPEAEETTQQTAPVTEEKPAEEPTPEVKPSDKYTPVTPPSEKFNNEQ